VPIWRWADLQVQVGPVNHESWWSHNSGSIAVAIAAIVAASLAAYVSIRNRREELTQSRDLNERGHIRDTLDSALEQIDQTIAAIIEVASDLAIKDRVNDDAREAWKVGSEEHLDRAVVDVLVMRGQQVRLELRLGPEHPIALRHKQLLDRLSG
jgi:hypothetical protein